MPGAKVVNHQGRRKIESLIPLVREVHQKSRETYGTRRMAEEIEANGTTCGRYKARTLMKMAGVCAKQKRKFKATTDSKHNDPVAPNLLNREFRVEEPDKVYVSDITYIWTNEGWFYLAVFIDLFSRRVVGWSLNQRMSRSLVMNAFRMAIWRRKPLPGLLVHSDRGSQYCSGEFQKMLADHRMISSMSRKGNCWDNGWQKVSSAD